MPIPVVVGEASLREAYASVYGTKANRVPAYLVDLLRYHIRVGIDLGLLTLNYTTHRNPITLETAERILSKAHLHRPRRHQELSDRRPCTIATANLQKRLNLLIKRGSISATSMSAAPHAPIAA